MVARATNNGSKFASKFEKACLVTLLGLCFELLIKEDLTQN
jgi:hypothetical protein